MDKRDSRLSRKETATAITGLGQTIAAIVVLYLIARILLH
jgi:hypothetical protein